MSWLFCCGGSEAQKHHEKQGTFDLSKPIMAPPEISNCDGLNELSGNPSENSQKLDAIIKAKANNKNTNTQPKGSTL